MKSKYTKEFCLEMLDLWVEAEKAVATGQSYRIGTRELKRADLSEIVSRIEYWRNELDKIEDGKGRGCRIFRAVPRDL